MRLYEADHYKHEGQTFVLQENPIKEVVNDRDEGYCYEFRALAICKEDSREYFLVWDCSGYDFDDALSQEPTIEPNF
jgi:hypothetical protein